MLAAQAAEQIPMAIQRSFSYLENRRSSRHVGRVQTSRHHLSETLTTYKERVRFERYRKLTLSQLFQHLGALKYLPYAKLGFGSLVLLGSSMMLRDAYKLSRSTSVETAISNGAISVFNSPQVEREWSKWLEHAFAHPQTTNALLYLIVNGI